MSLQAILLPIFRFIIIIILFLFFLALVHRPIMDTGPGL